jgi:hypothetical protein
MTATEGRTPTRPQPERPTHRRPADPPPRQPDPRAVLPTTPAGVRRLAAEQLGVAAGQLGAGVGNLVFALVAARVLAPGAFADLAAFLALYLLIHVPAASLSAGSAMAPELAAAARRRALAAGGAVGGALVVLSVPLAALLHVPVGILLAAAVAAPTAGLIALERGRLYGLQRHRRAVASLLAEPAVRLAIGVALAALAGPVGGALAVVAAGWAALLVALPRDRDESRAAGNGASPAAANGASPAVPHPRSPTGVAVAAFLLLALVQNQDVLLANAVLDPVEAGRFAVLSTLGGVAAFASTTVPLMLLPRGGRDALRAALGVAALLGVGALAVVAISPGALVELVFGARYAPVGAIAVPYVLAMALLGVARVLVAHLCVARPPRATLALLGATAAGHVALVLAIGHDAAGVATATLAATVTLTAGAAALTLHGTPAATRAAARALAALRRPDIAALIAITAGGGVLRMLATRGIWLDEATSIHQAQMSIGALLDSLRTTDVHPPLHHLALWLTVRVFGTGELAVRVPSLIAATALIPVIYLAGRDIYDRRAGLAAAGLTAVAPFPVWYAQEARMYALFMLFAALAVWMQIRVLRDGGGRNWLGYVLAAAALVYTQYFGILFVGVQQLGFLVALWRVRHEPDELRPLGLAWIGWSLFFILLVVPLMGFAQAQFAANEAAGKGFEQVPSQAGGTVGEIAGRPPGAYAALTNAVWAVLGYHSNATMTALAAMWPLLLLLALGMLGRGRSWRTLLLAACAVVPAIVLFGLGQMKPLVFEVRYFVGAVPLVLLLIGRALTSWTLRAGATVAVCCVAALALAIGEADQQFNGSNPRVYDFKGAVHSIERRARPGDLLVFTPSYLDHVVAYYRDGSDVSMRPLSNGLPRLARGQRVFLLASFLDKPQFRQSTQAAVRRLDARYRLVNAEKRPQIRTWEFSR